MEHEAKASGTLTSLAFHFSVAALRSGLLSLFLLTLWAAVLLVELTSFWLPRRIVKFLGPRMVIIATMLLSKIFDTFLSFEVSLASLVEPDQSSSVTTEVANLTNSMTKPRPSTKQANGQM